MKISSEQLESMGKLERVQLATSLPGPKPVCLLGTQSKDGLTNLAPFSSVTHLGSNPALIGVVTRPATVERHSLQNIIDTGVWTLNHVHQDIVDKAHQCSARYRKSEFTATGLTPHFEPGVGAPFVLESLVRYALKLREIVNIGANNTQLIVGEVTFIEFNDEFLEPDGGIDIQQAGTLASTALDTYFEVSKFKKIPYAKP